MKTPSQTGAAVTATSDEEPRGRRDRRERADSRGNEIRDGVGDGESRDVGDGENPGASAAEPAAGARPRRRRGDELLELYGHVLLPSVARVHRGGAIRLHTTDSRSRPKRLPGQKSGLSARRGSARGLPDRRVRARRRLRPPARSGRRGGAARAVAAPARAGGRNAGARHCERPAAVRATFARHPSSPSGKISSASVRGMPRAAAVNGSAAKSLSQRCTWCSKTVRSRTRVRFCAQRRSAHGSGAPKKTASTAAEVTRQSRHTPHASATAGGLVGIGHGARRGDVQHVPSRRSGSWAQEWTASSTARCAAPGPARRRRSCSGRPPQAAPRRRGRCARRAISAASGSRPRGGSLPEASGRKVVDVDVELGVSDRDESGLEQPRVRLGGVTRQHVDVAEAPQGRVGVEAGGLRALEDEQRPVVRVAHTLEQQRAVSCPTAASRSARRKPSATGFPSARRRRAASTSSRWLCRSSSLGARSISASTACQRDASPTLDRWAPCVIVTAVAAPRHTRVG